MNLRFVILHHTGSDNAHYDLMFETSPESKLTTFRLPDWPIDRSTEAERIGDHRREYLAYEGPLSDDRGEVERVVCGAFDFESKSQSHYTLLTDSNLRLTLSKTDQGWLAEVGQIP
jgi:hypothetical protein